MSAASPTFPSRRARSRALAAACAGAALLALAGCSDPNKFAPACPELRLLPDGANLTRYDGRGQDITNQVLQARIDGVPFTGTCKWVDDRKQNRVAVDMQLALTATRGPAMQGRRVVLPYFVAVGQGQNGQEILQREAYGMVVDFPGNLDRLALTSEPIHLVLPVTPTRSAAAYTVWVSLQLTPDEVAYNRAHPDSMR